MAPLPNSELSLPYVPTQRGQECFQEEVRIEIAWKVLSTVSSNGFTDVSCYYITQKHDRTKCVETVSSISKTQKTLVKVLLGAANISAV